MGRGAGSRGMSLIELLVSVTILLIAMTVAMKIYIEARVSYKAGENAAEQQQSVRIAFDMISHDLRVAGRNTNPDGDHNRPDEPIEAAFDTGIVLRADFDATDPATFDLPEQALAGGAYPVVSTGNDEIRGYVLSKQDAAGTVSGPDTLTFQADVSEVPRDGDVENVDVDRVDLAQGDPPYTLYRVQLDNDAGKYGSPGFITRVPLVENVRALRFRYYDRAGNLIAAPGGDDTPAARRSRAKIARVELEIEGLTPDPDPNTSWVDPADGDPDTQHFRKFTIAGDVTPRNLGTVGIRDLSGGSFLPGTPGAPTLTAGHCGGLLVDWPPNPTYDNVAYYRVLYGPSLGSLTSQLSTTGTHIYIDGLPDGVNTTVVVEAVNTSGATSAPSPDATEQTRNLNTPETPLNFALTNNPTGQIELAWDAVTANTTAVPDAFLRDLAGYDVYRGLSPGFTPSPGNRVAGPPAVGDTASPTWTDPAALSCRTFHYKVAAVDDCGQESGFTSEVSGLSVSTDPPLKPVPLNVHYNGVGGVDLQWTAIGLDVNFAPIYVDRYEVWRTNAPVPDANPAPSVPGAFSLLATVTGGANTYNTGGDPPGSGWWYAVRAVDGCGNVSTYTYPKRASCNFSGTLQIDNPTPNAQIPVWATTQVRVVGGTGVYTRAIFEYRNLSTGVNYSDMQAGAGPTWSDYFTSGNPDYYDDGQYEVTATVVQDIGGVECHNSVSQLFRLGP